MKPIALPIACTLLLATAVTVPLHAQKKKPATDAPKAPVAAPVVTLADAAEKESFLENPWRMGALLQDTNGDKIVDAVCGHVIVPENPGTAENTAAANIAARIGYETSALSLPIVVQGAPQAVKGCPAANAPNIWIGEAAVPAASAAAVRAVASTLVLGDGAVVAIEGGIAIIGPDPVGLMNAANAYAERAPFLWSIPGEKLSITAKNINTALTKAKSTATAELTALVFSGNNGGVRRAIVRINGTVDAAALPGILKPEEGTPVSFGAVREVQILVGETRLSFNGAAPQRATALPAMPDAGGDARSLDLARLYTVKGLLTGSAKKPIPSGTAAKLYVPAGAQGIAMANLAARIGLETVGITLPIAMPEAGVSQAQIQGTPVIAEGSPAADHLRDLMMARPNTNLDKLQPGGGKVLPALAAGEGELRVVEHGADKADALLVRGDAAGATAALGYAADPLP